MDGTSITTVEEVASERVAIGGAGTCLGAHRKLNT
jgi:hypothetical protein